MPPPGRHYSYALYDACAQLTAPLVEVHISAPEERPEEFRHTSVVTPHADRVHLRLPQALELLAAIDLAR